MKESLFINKIILTLALAIIIVSGCTASTQDLASSAVEAYIKALQAKDLNQMINLSCAAWEADAKLEYDSFAAVETTLEGLSCQETDTQENFTLVTCSGQIIASYGAEDLIIDLSERNYRAVQEGGEWRMCGYQ